MNKTSISGLVVMLAALFACKKADLDGISNLNNNKIEAIGHGGMGITSSYPIDTYESLSAALVEGADGVEIDVQMTSDSVLVAFHNNKLDDNTSCTGMINELTWSELRDCEYVNEIFGLHKITSLEGLLNNWAEAEGKTLVFDCKLIPSGNSLEYNTAFANQLVELVEANAGASDVLFESQSTAFLQLIQVQQPSYKLFIYPSTFEYGLLVARAFGFYGITMASSDVSEEQIQDAHADGFRVAIWNIDSRRDNVEAINKSPDYIQTDKLKSLLRLLK